MGNKYIKLAKCVLLDAIGMASAAIPVAGPVIDVIWAPVAASISYKLFGNKRGKYTSLITFIEELLPVTDFIPSFTIFWIKTLMNNRYLSGQLKELILTHFGLGQNQAFLF